MQRSLRVFSGLGSGSTAAPLCSILPGQGVYRVGIVAERSRGVVWARETACSFLHVLQHVQKVHVP